MLHNLEVLGYLLGYLVFPRKCFLWNVGVEKKIAEWNHEIFDFEKKMFYSFLFTPFSPLKMR